MTLIDDVKKVLLLSWTVRFSGLAVLAGALAQLAPDLPLLKDFIPANYYAFLSMLFAAAAAIARVIKQTNISGPAT